MGEEEGGDGGDNDDDADFDGRRQPWSLSRAICFRSFVGGSWSERAACLGPPWELFEALEGVPDWCAPQQAGKSPRGPIGGLFKRSWGLWGPPVPAWPLPGLS